MPVKIINEAEDLGEGACYDGPPEVCVVCRAALTRNWWGGGCAPVCGPCASKPETTHAFMMDLCQREHWGPLPTENTDVEAP